MCVCAGRREQTSVSIYVAFDGPLDQFYMREPHRLFAAHVETPQVDPQNVVLLEQHLTCAAAELPLVALDERYFGAVRPQPPSLLTIVHIAACTHCQLPALALQLSHTRASTALLRTSRRCSACSATVCIMCSTRT